MTKKKTKKTRKPRAKNQSTNKTVVIGTPVVLDSKHPHEGDIGELSQIDVVLPGGIKMDEITLTAQCSHGMVTDKLFANRNAWNLLFSLKSGHTETVNSPSPSSPKRPVGRPPKWEDPQDLQNCIDAYFDYCDGFTVMEDVYQGGSWVGQREVRRPKPYTVAGLALWLDVDRLTLLRYAEKEEFCNTIRQGKARIEVQLEEKLLTAQSSGVAFNLKNNFGYKDKSEVENTHKGGLSLVAILDKAEKAQQELDKPNT